VQKLLQIAKKNKAPVAIIGEVGARRLVINRLINLSVNELYKTWRKAIAEKIKQ